MSRHAGSLTIEKAMAESPQLSMIEKEFGEKQTGAFLMKLLGEVAVMTKTDIDPTTAGLTAQAIMQEYRGLKYDEIILALRQGVMGKYGETSWKGISFQAIMEWMHKYFVQRDEVLHQQHLDRKSQSGNSSDRGCQTVGEFWEQMKPKH